MARGPDAGAPVVGVGCEADSNYTRKPRRSSARPDRRPAAGPSRGGGGGGTAVVAAARWRRQRHVGGGSGTLVAAAARWRRQRHVGGSSGGGGGGGGDGGGLWPAGGALSGAAVPAAASGHARWPDKQRSAPVAAHAGVVPTPPPAAWLPPTGQGRLPTRRPPPRPMWGLAQPTRLARRRRRRRRPPPQPPPPRRPTGSGW